MMKSITKQFTQHCQDIFGDNLIGLLLLGSEQRGDKTPFSDIDLIAILEEIDNEQVSMLRDTVRSMPTLIDCSIITRKEIPTNPDIFRYGTHGCYHLALVLKKAQILCGENIFVSLPNPSMEAIRRSIFEKIIEYTWWVRRMFVESNRPRTLEANYKLNSRIIKLIRDVYYLAAEIGMDEPADDVIKLFLNKYGNIFDEDERLALGTLATSSHIEENAANISEEYFTLRHSIVNKIYELALSLI